MAPTEFVGQESFFAKVKVILASRFPETRFLNLNEYVREMGLAESDFRDEGHLFLWGQEKTTAWLGTYLLGQNLTLHNTGGSWWKHQVPFWQSTRESFGLTSSSNNGRLK